MTSGLDYSEVFSRAMHGSGEIDLYGDSAELFDVLYSNMSTREKKEASARRNIAEGEKILDLACGTGIVSEFLDEDYQVTGADISREMLEIAREKNLEADFVQADMRDLPFEEEFDAVVMYGQPFSHLESKSDARESAREIYSALKDGGILITDVFAADTGKFDVLGPVKDVLDEDHEVAMRADFRDYNPSDQSWESYMTFELRKNNLSTQVRHHQPLRGYSTEEMDELLSGAGFSTVGEEDIYPTDLYNGIWAVK